MSDDNIHTGFNPPRSEVQITDMMNDLNCRLVPLIEDIKYTPIIIAAKILKRIDVDKYNQRDLIKAIKLILSELESEDNE